MILSGEWFAREALAQVPKLLTLLDRNKHSPTYGCFDRNYWQYKIIDFPSGMAQEFCWPLALAYATPLSENSFYAQSAIRHWVEAAILFAARSAHADGSCDDYFPYEKAAGAAAFSLLACVESYQLLKLKNDEILNFFQKRASWLADHEESGRLTNHQALIVLALEVTSDLLKINHWDKAKARRLEKVLSWQHEEGWFPEYEGCDPGYHTLTISCLAWLYRKNPNPKLKEALTKAVKLAAEFIHPDGSFGGEYTSRNTYNFFPHGFEVVGQWMPEALAINDLFLKGAHKGLAPCYADDHIIGHHTWNYFLAWRDFVSQRPNVPNRKAQVWLKGAKVLIDRRAGNELYLALNKGGVFKFFRDEQLIVSDTQISLKVKEGSKIRNAVGHLIGDYQVKMEPNRIQIQGKLGWAKQKLMTPFRLVALRGLMLSVGRFFPDLVRKLLQKMLITGKNEAPFSFKRVLTWQEDGKLKIEDELLSDSWENVVDAGIGGDQTSIYVVMSRTYQAGQLQPWFDLMPEIKKLKAKDSLKIERIL